MRRNVRLSKNLVRIMWRNYIFLGFVVIKFVVFVNIYFELLVVDEFGVIVWYFYWFILYILVEGFIVVRDNFFKVGGID